MPAKRRPSRPGKGGGNLGRLSRQPRRPFPPNKPNFGDGLIGPPERPGKKLRGAAKVAGGVIYDALETTANPAAPLWNRLVGPDSKLNTKNLTKKLLPGRLKDLVPTPRGKKKPPERKPQKSVTPPRTSKSLVPVPRGKNRSPERKPQKSVPLKTWRDRMNSRQNLN